MIFDFRDVPGSRLAGEPSAWDVEMVGGALFVVYGDMRGQVDDRYVFELMLDGDPVKLMPVVHGPCEVFGRMLTEFPEDPLAAGFDWNRCPGLQLSARPHAWQLTLNGGHDVTIHANRHSETEDKHLFTLDVAGGGPGLPVLQVDHSLVQTVRRRELLYMWLHED